MEGNEGISRRGRALGFVILAMMSLYLVKLFSMQIIRGEDYRRQSQNISQRSKKIPAQRGEIYDRNATVPMGLNIDSFAVDITPGEVPRSNTEPSSPTRGQARMRASDVEAKIPATVRRSFQAIEVRANVPYETIASIAESIDDLPGVSWHSKPIRNYVETGSIAHIIGYVGDITRDELKLFYNKGYTTSSVIGKAG
jgi:penicillin-binding protein 2